MTVLSTPAAPWPGELVTLDVGQVFVRSAGDPAAQAAVFVHGLGGSALNWTDLMAALSQPDPDDPGQAALYCEALDLPGFGHSPPSASGDYSLDARVATVVSLIEKRGRWPVHLIGNSLGGAVCTRVAARRPDLVRTLTLIAPALPDLRPRLLPLRLLLVSVPGVGRTVLGGRQRVPAAERTEQMVRELFADPSLLHPVRRAETEAEVVRRDSLGYSDDVLIATSRAIVAEYARPAAASLWREAALVSAPTLVVYGSQDRLVHPAMAAKAARTFKHVRVHVLPRIGHVAMMERPDLVAELIRVQLASLGAPRPKKVAS
jgi:pimeloyl-ACP methyl ester carboxylesterase